MGRDRGRPLASISRSRSSSCGYEEAWWAELRGELGSREATESLWDEEGSGGVWRDRTTTTWFIVWRGRGSEGVRE